MPEKLLCGGAYSPIRYCENQCRPHIVQSRQQPAGFSVAGYCQNTKKVAEPIAPPR